MSNLQKRGRLMRARQQRLTPRIVLLADARSPDGEPRAGLMIPGAKFPVVYPNMAAATAALEAGWAP